MTFRVLFVGAGPQSLRCGVGDYIRSLAKALKQIGVDASLLFEEVNSEVDGASLQERDADRGDSGWSLGKVKLALRILNAESCDIVHIHYPSQTYRGSELPWLLPLCCRLIGRPVVVTLHEPVSWLRSYRLLILRLSGAILLTVRANYRDLLGWPSRFFLAGKEISYIKSASTLPKSSLDAEGLRDLRKRFGEPERLLLFFGFLYRDKGADQILEIAGDPGDHIVFAGATPDQQYLNELKSVICSRGLNERVTFLGEVPSQAAADLIAAADALVLPFITGGGDWNTSILAGVLHGTFVLTTSRDCKGYDAAENVYYAEPCSTGELRSGLEQYCGSKLRSLHSPVAEPWAACADTHSKIYDTYRR